MAVEKVSILISAHQHGSDRLVDVDVLQAEGGGEVEEQE